MSNDDSPVGASTNNNQCEIIGLTLGNEEILTNFSKNYEVQHVLGTLVPDFFYLKSVMSAQLESIDIIII